MPSIAIAMPSIAIVYHTTYGQTKLQAEAVQRGAQSFPGASVCLYSTEAAAASLDELDSADAIIFGDHGIVTSSRANCLEPVPVIPISRIGSWVARSVPTVWVKAGVTVCHVCRSGELCTLIVTPLVPGFSR